MLVTDTGSDCTYSLCLPCQPLGRCQYLLFAHGLATPRLECQGGWGVSEDERVCVGEWTRVETDCCSHLGIGYISLVSVVIFSFSPVHQLDTAVYSRIFVWTSDSLLLAYRTIYHLQTYTHSHSTSVIRSKQRKLKILDRF